MKYLFHWLWACFLLCAQQLQSQPFSWGGIEVTDSDISIETFAQADDGCVPGVDTDQNDLSNVQLTPTGPLMWQLLPTSLGTRYLRSKASQKAHCINNDARSFAGCEVGGSSDGMQIRLQMFSGTFHKSECVPYASIAEGNIEASIELTIPSSSLPPGTPPILYYSLNAWMAAISVSESGHEDPAWVSLNQLSLGGVDFIQAGNFPTGYSTGPGFSGNGGPLLLDGFLVFTPDVPFTLNFSAEAYSELAPTGNPIFNFTCGDRLKDQGGACVLGTLTLSLDPVNIPGPPQEQPALSYFSVDIGGDTELSDPNPTGTEVFDPGDAYLVRGPALPFGGQNGPIDDADFFFGIDIAPSPPDIAIPSLTAAPVGSGLPLSSIQTSYFNLDGLSRAPIDLEAADPDDWPGPIPMSSVTVPGEIPCIYSPTYVYVSYDDDAPGHYADANPSVPANSTYTYLNKTFGSTADRDEVVQLVFMPPALGGFSGVQPLARETDIHQSLAPNPQPTGPDSANDDVDALSLGYSGTSCDVVYISVDHEATGEDPNGNPLDPGVIYRVSSAAGAGLVPAILPEHMGLLPGTDVDAFEFTRSQTVAEDGTAFSVLAVLFSVDVNDPLTPNDESGGLDPEALYISVLDGSHAIFDSSYTAEGNIDAISILPVPLTSSFSPQTCNSYNFSQPPSGLQVSVSTNSVDITWDPYPYAVQCQIAGNNVNQANDQTFLVNAASPPNVNSFSIPASQLSANQVYRVRVRCGCSLSNVSPFTAYEFFTMPPGPTPPMDFFENEGKELHPEYLDFVVEMFPNPARDFTVLRFDEAIHEPVSVLVYNAMGQLVKQEYLQEGVLSEHRLQLGDLSPGIYNVQIMTVDRRHTLSLVKQ